MYHTGVNQRLNVVTLFERILNHMLISIVQLGYTHFVFTSGRSIMDNVFVLQFLQETYKEKEQDVHMVSADRLSLQRFDVEDHVNDRYVRGVHQCADTL